VSQGYTRDYEGSGLGLTISQELAELLGGTIEIESTEGGGSVFTVQVPQHAPGAAPAEAEAPPEEAPSPTADRSARAGRPPEVHTPQADPSPDTLRTVLLVEDNALTREVLPLLIQKTGAPFTIDVAATAEEALDKAMKTTYDLFLIDINLGFETTGVDVMSRLRDDAQYASTPMIACTAYAMPGDEEQFLEAGFDAYLAKPFRKDELIDVMNRVTRSAGAS
jgi:CheY-like chemotaxis protein